MMNPRRLPAGLIVSSALITIPFEFSILVKIGTINGIIFNQCVNHLIMSDSSRYSKFGGLNEKCYKNVLELLIRMKANYLWPAMWGNSFSDEGKEFKLANVVLADAYGVCMGT